MKKIYVAHPLRGSGAREEDFNRRMVRLICQEIAEAYPDILIFSPIQALSFLPAYGDQTTAFRHCRGWLEVCDELWVFGNWELSEGCTMEVAVAQLLGKPVIFKDARRRAGG